MIETRRRDRIEKTVQLQAPIQRVWEAISDARHFGTWFGAQVSGAFEPGATVEATIAPTEVDEHVAEKQRPYAGRRFAMMIERVEPMRVFSYRWHPYAVDADIDYAEEPSTLVTFALEEVENGTILTITESGFDQIPIARRASAFDANEEGWTLQAALIRKYLARTG